VRKGEVCMERRSQTMTSRQVINPIDVYTKSYDWQVLSFVLMMRLNRYCSNDVRFVWVTSSCWPPKLQCIQSPQLSATAAVAQQARWHRSRWHHARLHLHALPGSHVTNARRVRSVLLVSRSTTRTIITLRRDQVDEFLEPMVTCVRQVLAGIARWPGSSSKWTTYR